MLTVTDLQHLGPAMSRLRHRTGKQQKEISEATGMSRSQVSRYERGRDTPNLITLVKFLEQVGADLQDLHLALQEVKCDAMEASDVLEEKPALEAPAFPARRSAFALLLFELIEPRIRHLIHNVVDAKLAAERESET